MQKFPYHIIDLTHVVHKGIPTWDGSCGFTSTCKLDYSDCTSPVKFRVQQVSMDAGIGTHIDSPAHCIPGSMTVEHLMLSDLIAPCVVIDVSHHALANYVVQLDEVKAFEKRYGKIPAGTFVIFYTGWERYWQLPDQYGYQYPTIDPGVAILLVERNIAGLGVDTLSPDGRDSAFQVHHILLSHGKYIVENIANAQQLPAVGSFALVLPIKAAGLTEAPIRLLGLIEMTSNKKTLKQVKNNP